MLQNKKKIIGYLEFPIIFSAAVLRFLYFGFKYYPLLDDYIQYHNYPSSIDYWLLIKQEGLLASRPLAGILDLFVWSNFWGNMIIAVIILSAMWAASTVLFRRLFDSSFGCGYLFSAIYTLLPLGIEGTYWISASSRIVCGMFFTAVALTIYRKIVDQQINIARNIVLITAFSISQLLSFCFYEQILVLSFSMTLLLMFYSLISKKRKALWGLLSFANVAVYFIFTSVNSSGNLTSRMKIILPVSKYYFDTFLPTLLNQFKAVFINGNFYTIFKGFYRGVQIIAEEKLFSAAVIILACGIIWYIAARTQNLLFQKNSEEISKANYRMLLGIIFAVLIAIAPVTPYFIIENPYFSFRGAVPSFCGIALLADIFVRFLLSKTVILIKNKTKRLKICSIFPALLSGLCCMLFMTSAVSELADYKAVHENDLKITTALIELYDNDPELSYLYKENKLEKKRIGIFNLNANMLPDQNYYYHEHICGVTENSWALTGMTAAVRPESEASLSLPEAVPLAIETAIDGKIKYYEQWNASVKRISRFDYLYWYDSENTRMFRVYSEQTENGILISDGSNCLAKIIENTDNTAYIELLS